MTFWGVTKILQGNNHGRCNCLAKNVFAVHGIDKNGNAVLVKLKVARTALPELIANLPPCTVGTEACSGTHYWARLSGSMVTTLN